MPKDIAAFFDRYREAFNALDGDAVAQLYAEPSAIAQGGKFTYWPTRAPVRENMAALCALYRERGYVRASYEPGHFLAQGPDHAIADLRWRIDWTSDQEPWEFNTTYNLVRGTEGWQVQVCTAYTEDKLHQGSQPP